MLKHCSKTEICERKPTKGRAYPQINKKMRQKERESIGRTRSSEAERERGRVRE